mmetsp:Transcript_88056/g.285035  ORF Transcript_88056/g.285035 Transcript_88056/m.285035 type:complete len:90 (-) Transcript_88056:126-395(-)
MDDSFQSLKSTLHEALSRVDKAIDHKRADAQKAMGKLMEEREQLNAEWEQLEGERTSLMEAHADVDAKLEEVERMKGELLSQKQALGLK